MSIYFNEHGSAIGYQVEGRWLIKGDYLKVEHGPNIPGGLYKMNRHGFNRHLRVI